MRLGENSRDMNRLSNMCKIVGVMVILWIIKAISIHIELDTNDKCNEYYLSTFEYAEETTQEETTQEESLTVGPIETIPVGDLTEENIENNEDKVVVQPEKYVYLSDEELYALACLVWLEGRGESIECQEAIASVVINRYVADREKYTSLFDVIYEPLQFSPAGNISKTKPTQVQIDVVNKVVTCGPTIPVYVTFFRSKYFHSWGDQVPYKCMSNTYFSYSNALKEQLGYTEVIK